MIKSQRVSRKQSSQMIGLLKPLMLEPIRSPNKKSQTYEQFLIKQKSTSPDKQKKQSIVLFTQTEMDILAKKKEKYENSKFITEQSPQHSSITDLKNNKVLNSIKARKIKYAQSILNQPTIKITSIIGKSFPVSEANSPKKMNISLTQRLVSYKNLTEESNIFQPNCTNNKSIIFFKSLRNLD